MGTGAGGNTSRVLEQEETHTGYRSRKEHIQGIGAGGNISRVQEQEVTYPGYRGRREHIQGTGAGGNVSTKVGWYGVNPLSAKTEWKSMVLSFSLSYWCCTILGDLVICFLSNSRRKGL